MQLLSAGFAVGSLITEVGDDILRSVRHETRSARSNAQTIARCSTMPLRPQAVRAATVNNRHGLLTLAMRRGAPSSVSWCAEISAAGFDPGMADQVVAEVRVFGFVLRRGTSRDGKRLIRSTEVGDVA